MTEHIGNKSRIRIPPSVQRGGIMFSLIAVCLLLIGQYTIKLRRVTPYELIVAAETHDVPEIREKSEKEKIRDKLYLNYTNSMKLNEIQNQRKKNRRVPDIIGIGVEKCGTGALRNILLKHPMVHSANPPESHFFGGWRYSKGIQYYINQMPEIFEHELSFEKTPSYFNMNSKYVPWQIRRDVPNAKIILVLCDPVNRTFSDFVQEMLLKNIPVNTNFGLFINREIGMLSSDLNELKDDDDAMVDYLYKKLSSDKISHLLMTGMYYYHLARWYKVYNKTDIHIVDGEELITDPGTVIEKMQKFLDIPIFIIKEDFEKTESGFICPSDLNIVTIENEQSVVKQKPKCMPTLSKGRTRQGNWKYTPTNNTIEALRRFFEPYNRKLYTVLGKKFNWQTPSY